MLNEEQQKAVDIMRSGVNCFVSGDAGTGKSYTLNYFINLSKKDHKNVVVVAPTGIAAINVDGVTLHRLLRLSPRPVICSVEDVKINRMLVQCDILILEEVSMCRMDLFDYLAISIGKANKLRKEKGLNTIQFIVCGDFFQLPPVLTDRDKEILDSFYGYDVGKAFAFQSKYWKQIRFTNIVLHTVVRQSDKTFSELLNKVRTGNRLAVYEIERLSRKQELQKAIYLSSTNKSVNEKNEAELNALKGIPKKYIAEMAGDLSNSDKMAEDELTLKVNARVMTLVNDFGKGYKNGSLGTILEMKDDYVTVSIDGGGVVNIYPYIWEVKNYSVVTKNKRKVINEEIVGTFTQLPLKLAYAITIHKSQGQTYKSVNLNPRSWDYGQLYVALSRVESLDGLYLTSEISPNYLLTSPEVLDFYANL